MGSIAYVTDEKMLAYHRLCRNQSILFWRLSNKKFTDFHKGDLLFFFARPNHGRKKALIGYAHYDSEINLTLKQMWNRYGDSTGYDTQGGLYAAIEKASRGNIPPQMNCLYLTNVVFFLSPVYPEDVGISIQNNLESYCYLDKDSPKITAKILQQAQKHGIDLWSANPNITPEEIFKEDATKHYLAVISQEIGQDRGNERQQRTLERYAKQKVKESGWELIRGSNTECIYMNGNEIQIAIPFVSQVKEQPQKIREYIGRLTMYRLLAKHQGLEGKIRFEILSPNIPDELKEMVEEINNE
ncbi:hypothetical protein QLX55_10060 [Solobacterium moorei]|uniref:hypothetical protein n=1 Tax=Solobacterium moorei TaxID=102148 RepID=UPI0024AD9134|nr:hypothetical protein [Solobacterium moorei]MDI6415669.1 hypothetical protein [Solobacterium moorei]